MQKFQKLLCFSMPIRGISFPLRVMFSMHYHFLFLKAVIFRTIKLTAAKKADMVNVIKGAALCRCGRKRRALL